MVDSNLDGIDDSQQTAQYNVNKIYIDGFTNRAGGRGASVAEAKNYFKNLRETNQAAYDALVNAAKIRGLPADSKSIKKIMDAAVDWTQSLNNPLRSQADGIDPAAYLDYLKPGSIDFGDSAGPKYGTSKQITEQTTQYSPSSGAQTISDTMEQELGRTASAAEIAAGTTGLNAAAMKEPSKYEGTTTTSPGGKGISLGQTVTKGTQTTGFDPTMFARNFARSQPDFAESFAAKTFLKLVSGLLTDPNAIGQVVSDGR